MLQCSMWRIVGQTSTSTSEYNPMRHIVSECMNININIRVESIAQCDDVLSANAGQLITVHMGQLPSVTANLSEITLYKYTVVQNANTNTQMYRVQIQIQTARCTHVPWQGVTIFYTVDNRCAKASNMGDGRTIQIQCCLCSRRHWERDWPVHCSATQAAPREWCQQNWCYMYVRGTSTSTCTSGARAVTGTPHRAGSCLWCPPTPLLCI